VSCSLLDLPPEQISTLFCGHALVVSARLPIFARLWGRPAAPLLAKYSLHPDTCRHPSSGPHFCVTGRLNPGSVIWTSTVSYLLAVTLRDWSKVSSASCSTIILTCTHLLSARLLALAPACSGGRSPARKFVADPSISAGRARQLLHPAAEISVLQLFNRTSSRPTSSLLRSPPPLSTFTCGVVPSRNPARPEITTSGGATRLPTRLLPALYWNRQPLFATSEKRWAGTTKCLNYA
jgi:hypothetical protein